MEVESLKEGVTSLLYKPFGARLYGGLLSHPVGMENRLTWPLHVLGGVFLSHEVGAVIQLLPL